MGDPNHIPSQLPPKLKSSQNLLNSHWKRWCAIHEAAVIIKMDMLPVALQKLIVAYVETSKEEYAEHVFMNTPYDGFRDEHGLWRATLTGESGVFWYDRYYNDHWYTGIEFKLDDLYSPGNLISRLQAELNLWQENLNWDRQLAFVIEESVSHYERQPEPIV